MTYPQEAIEKLTETIQTDSPATLNWLINNGYKELTMITEAACGDDKSLEWLIRNKHIIIAAFINAVREDSKAFDLLFKLKAFVWAAAANVVNGDKKAAVWLRDNKLEYFVKFAVILKEKIRRDSDEGLMNSITKVGSPY